jgi:hypothetical protein
MRGKPQACACNAWIAALSRTKRPRPLLLSELHGFFGWRGAAGASKPLMVKPSNP